MNTFQISMGGETINGVAQTDVFVICDQLIAKYGAGVPEIKAEAAFFQSEPEVVAPVVPETPARPSAWISKDDTSFVRAESAARIAADMDAAKAAGFAPEKPLFAVGTLLVPDGVKRGHSLRQEFEKKPFVGEAMDALVGQVHGEERHGIEIDRTSLRMDKVGRIVLRDGRRLQVEDRAFKQLVRRLGLPGGAPNYLAESWPELRAKNINNWQEVLESRETAALDEDGERDKIVLRARNTDRIYAAVSDSYTEFDVDKLALAVQRAMPPQARAQVHYDGYKAKIDVLFHSTVAPEDMGAGEYFRAGITLRTDDTGGGSIKGFSIMEQNLCLNILITSEQAQPIFQLTHIGDPDALAKKIREGLAKAEESLGHFLKQWGYARRDDLVAAAIARGEIVAGMTASEVMAALANGVIERDMVPVRGTRKEAVSGLVRAWEADTSDDGPKSGTVTRAGLVNAYTRWAHEGQTDAFFADEVQQAASKLLWPSTFKSASPAIIPAIPLA